MGEQRACSDAKLTLILHGLALVTLFTLGARAMHAQEASPAIAPGSVMRIAAPAAGITYRYRAVVDSTTADMIFVRDLTGPQALRGVAQVAVPIGAITRLDVRTAQRSRSSAIGKGALIGLATGILVPVGIVMASGSLDEPDSWGWGGVAMGVAAIVPWTSGIGAAVGALVPIDRWQRVVPARD